MSENSKKNTALYTNEEKYLRRRAIETRFWELGNLDFLLHSGQHKVSDLTPERNLAVINCSRQWGKTRWACTKNLEDCLKYPGITNKYGSAHYEDLKQYIYPNMQDIIALAPAHIQRRIELQPSNKRMVVKHKGKRSSIVHFVGLDKNPNGLRGNKVHRFTIEEAGYVKDLMYIWFDVVFPMFTHMPDAMCYFIGTPSDSPEHEFVSYFMPRAKKELAYLHQTIEDNPLLSQKRKDYLIAEYFQEVNSEAMRKAQYAKMRRELYGEVLINYEQAIIPEFNPEVHVKPIVKDEHFQYYHKYIAMDLGVVDKTVALFAYYDFQEAKIKITHERIFHGATLTTDEIAKGLKETQLEAFKDFPLYRRISDSDNLLLVQDLGRLHDMPFKTTNKTTLHSMVNKVRLWMDQGRIEIDPRCVELIGCLSTGLWDDKRKQFARSTSYGHQDAVAALVYLIRNIDETTNPIPALYKVDIYNTYVNQNVLEKQENKTAVELMFPSIKKRKRRN